MYVHYFLRLAGRPKKIASVSVRNYGLLVRGRLTRSEPFAHLGAHDIRLRIRLHKRTRCQSGSTPGLPPVPGITIESQFLPPEYICSTLFFVACLLYHPRSRRTVSLPPPLVLSRQAHLQQKRQKQAWLEGAHTRSGGLIMPSAAGREEVPGPIPPKLVRTLTQDAPGGDGDSTGGGASGKTGGRS